MNNEIISGNKYSTIKRITNKYGIEKIGKIDSNSNLYSKIKYNVYMEDIIELLKSNYNIILHGAPGTGKTYLAKEVAREMDAEVGFVQFHPSYDYTDFVEGLRPFKNEDNDTLGFEPKDGIFKEFCSKALQNIDDSEKTIADLSFESIFKEAYNELINKINNEEIKEFQLKTDGKTVDIVRLSNNNNIILKTPLSQSDEKYTISLKRLLKLANVYRKKEDLDKINNISNEIRNIIKGCNASCYWAVLNYLLIRLKEQKPINAKLVKKKNFVFIIDEINRGEMSKIFGELFFSIDPGYRGTKGAVKTQYSNMCTSSNIFDDHLQKKENDYGWFYVPNNVYIIGTMNDIDRSVENMDFAMRRRFAFREITADESMKMLDNEESWKCSMNDNYRPDNNILNEIKNRMINLNKAIISDEIGLSIDYQLGAAYFLKYTLYYNSENPFELLWKNHLEGLLKEYLRGMDNDQSKIKFLKDAYNNVTDDDNNR